MTTSHRPTFFTAKGADRGGGQATFQVLLLTHTRNMHRVMIRLLEFLTFTFAFSRILSFSSSLFLPPGFFEKFELSYEPKVQANRSKCQGRSE